MPAPTNTVTAMAGAQAVLASAPDGTTFTTIANIKNIVPGVRKKSAPKVSCLASPLDGSIPAHEFSALGWLDTGEMSCELYYVKAGYTAIQTILTAAGLYTFKLTFNKVGSESVGGSTFVCAGTLVELGLAQLSTDDDNIVMMPIKIKWTSGPTFTAGT